ncbi:hypothetical protein MNBD_UNCLBAC01-729 [hydrothermal vent metagenome]|uniref:Death on curing protein, Doc toxin n=1 Tax=hydrothermal vent metagenome TaxID=652676 RepID=A0A3B1DPM7_9ZZZZ
MAQEVIWSYEAVEDLESIAAYISRDSEFYAASLVEEVMAATRVLVKFFEMGRVVPEFEDCAIREIFVEEYRIIYSIEKMRIDVLGIIHGRRDLKKLWKKEKRGK